MQPTVIATLHSGCGAPGGIADWGNRWFPLVGAGVAGCHVAVACSWPLGFVTADPSSPDGDLWMRELDERLRGWAEVFHVSNCPVTTQLLVGEPIPAIERYSRLSGASLLVVDASATSRYAEKCTVEMTAQLGHELNTSTVIVKGRVRGPGEGPVVVAYDGTEASQMALQEAIKWARRARCGIVLCTVLEQPPLGGDAPERIVQSRVEMVRQEQILAIEVAGSSVWIDPMVVVSSAGQGLAVAQVALEVRASLLVVGARAGRGPFMRSIGQEIALDSPVPVLVVPERLARSPWREVPRLHGSRGRQLDLAIADYGQRVPVPQEFGAPLR